MFRTSGATNILARLARDARGSVTYMAAIAAVPVFIGAGVAVDWARASSAHADFQAAVDSAVLAVAASEQSLLSGLTEAQKQARKDELKVVAREYILKNYTPDYAGGDDLDLDIEVNDSGSVTLSAGHSFPTTIMQLAGIDEMDLGAHAQAERERIPDPAVEIALVMDTTGSMSGTKLTNAKNAAKDLLDVLFEGDATSPYVKIALVPFSGSVNVGADKRTSGWIDTAGNSSVARLNFNNASWHNLRAWDELNVAGTEWNGCIEARPGAYGLNDAEPSAGTPDTLFVPYFHPDEPSVSSSTYSGTYTSYINTSGTPNELTSISSTSEAFSNHLNRQKNQNKYVNRTSFSSSSRPSTNCAGSGIVPLTSTKATVVAGIDAMVATGPTVIPEGLVWGWKVLSPTVPYTEGVAYDNPNWRKIIVLMTDGNNDVLSGGSATNNLNKSWYTAYGYGNAATGNRFGTTSTSALNPALDSKLAQLCTNVKNAYPAQPITIYTVNFGVTGGTVETLLSNCATTPEMYMYAPDGATLREHFKAIAGEILTNKVYLSK